MPKVAALSVLCLSLLFGCASIFHDEKSTCSAAAKTPKTCLRAEIAGLSPPDSAKNVATMSKMKITFKDTAQEIKTVPGTLCCLVSQYHEQLDCDIRCQKGSFSLIPKRRLYPATTYHVIVVNLAYGNKTRLSGKIDWSFTTANE